MVVLFSYNFLLTYEIIIQDMNNFHKQFSLISLLAPVATSNSVSYTHLDVYKRQLFIYPLSKVSLWMSYWR